MGFLYYIPGLHAAGRPEIQAAGLAYAFAGSPSTVRVASGPDGKGGLVLGDSPGFTPDKQTWRRIPGGQNWVGRNNADPLPAPDELARKDQLDGHWVTLADGRPWLCPVARGVSEEDGELRWFHRVPMILDLDDSGQWIPSQVAPRFKAIWDIAERWIAAQLTSDISEPDDEGNRTQILTFNDARNAAIECLAVNYRIGPTEAAILGLLANGKETAIEVLHALIDTPKRIEWYQKKILNEAQAGGLTADGSPVATADTGQP